MDMNNTDLNVIEFMRNSTRLGDYFSLGEMHPYLDTELGERSNFLLPRLRRLRNGLHSLRFLRPWRASDRFDADLTPGERIPLILSWGNGRLAYHGQNRRLIYITLPSPTSTGILWSNY